ncbi:hypothetical protein D9M72_404630 [compost metagenome]
MITPKIVKMFSELFVNAKANNAPMNDSGIENNTTNGYIKLLYNATITKYTKIIAANKAIPNVPKPSSWFSISPPQT